MIFADTDFFLSLIKRDDWLKKNALKVYEKYKGGIASSSIVLLELMFACPKYELDEEIVAGSFFGICDDVEGVTVEEGMKIAWLIKEKGFGAADAFHYVLSHGRVIVTSDRMFAKNGHDVIDLKDGAKVF
ncbi:MAG: PIN domain-containing protein [Candidatus Aenigmarchaeota archaeon]|nr:PIN domain-containing protein [Candidatus Aenigmarchaeota archaeon]